MKDTTTGEFNGVLLTMARRSSPKVVKATWRGYSPSVSMTKLPRTQAPRWLSPRVSGKILINLPVISICYILFNYSLSGDCRKIRHKSNRQRYHFFLKWGKKTFQQHSLARQRPVRRLKKTMSRTVRMTIAPSTHQKLPTLVINGKVRFIPKRPVTTVSGSMMVEK